MDSTIKLIEAEIPRLRRYARFLTGDLDRADDLVQESLARAIAKINSWQPGTNLRAWLFVILRNCFFNEVRREKRSPINHGDDEPAGMTPSNQEAHMELLEMRRAFLNLSDEHRDVLALVAIEGLSYEEASAVLGVPIGTVRSRASRARQALREAVGHDKTSDVVDKPVDAAAGAHGERP